MKFQAPRGTNDVLPDESYHWAYLENQFRELTRLYGYKEIRTPTFEETALFTRTSGETSDIVSKEMYTFTDKGGRSVTLKPEGTAPVIRAALEHGICRQGHVARLCYITPFFRFSRPQLGRYREAHQLGLELVGSAAAEADAEIIEITYRFFELLGLTDLTVMINSIGRNECRTNYREALYSFATPFIEGQSEEIQEKFQKNPLRLLDSKDPEANIAMQNAPSILDYLEPDSAERFEKIKSILKGHEVPFQVRPEIVRGLDYYTETVFEVQSELLGGQDSLCGGGRYDNLVTELGGPPLPAVGVGIGLERTLIALDKMGRKASSPALNAFVIGIGDDESKKAGEVVSQLRREGISCIRDYKVKDLRNAMKSANNYNAEFVVIIGPEELGSGAALVRNMQTGAQVQIFFNHLEKELKSLIADSRQQETTV